MPGYCQFERKETSVIFKSKYEIFNHENASENIVCEMATILYRGDESNAVIMHMIWFFDDPYELKETGIN